MSQLKCVQFVFHAFLQRFCNLGKELVRFDAVIKVQYISAYPWMVENGLEP